MILLPMISGVTQGILFYSVMKTSEKNQDGGTSDEIPS